MQEDSTKPAGDDRLRESAASMQPDVQVLEVPI